MKYNLLHKLISYTLRIAYHLLYHPFAWAYDFVAAAVSWGYWQEWVRTTLDFLEGPRVLEIGFGPGHLQGWLTEGGIAAFGVDTSPQMARRARKQAKNLSQAFSQAIPFPASYFDQVVTTFPSNTILHFDTFQEAWRVLKLGGRLIVLPIAWTHLFREKDPFEKASALSNHLLERFSKAGFNPRVERITQNSWSLILIIGRKISVNS